VTHVGEMARGLERANHEVAACAVTHSYAYARGRVLRRVGAHMSFGFALCECCNGPTSSTHNLACYRGM
jgi:hypothetical protein